MVESPQCPGPRCLAWIDLQPVRAQRLSLFYQVKGIEKYRNVHGVTKKGAEAPRN